MFDKKPSQQLTSDLDVQAVSVETIPASFYGGNDPVIYHEPETVVAPKKIASAIMPHPPLPKPQVRPAPASHQPVKSNKAYIIAGALIVLFAAGASAWFFLGGEEETVIVEQVSPTLPDLALDPVIEPDVPPVIVVSTTTAETELQEPDSSGPVPLDFPSIFTTDNTDDDADSLTDNEEVLFGTDSGVWDSDGDGYYDGQEVYNLYNPKGFAPVKLIDSGLVKEYVNPVWQYRVYYPAIWEVGSVDAKNDQVLISAVSGDYIEIRAIPKNDSETFYDWFARIAPNEQITDLQQSKNRFEELSWIRKDSLVGYIDQPLVVYVILYHPSVEGPVNYRHVMQMALQSFRPNKTSVVLPEQAVLPKPPQELPQENEENIGEVATPSDTEE